MPSPSDEVRIVRAGRERLDEIEPLTRALHAHHVTVDPGIPGIPPRDEDGWWRIRRRRYAAWLAGDDAFLLLAESADGGPVGYAFVTYHDEDDSHRTGGRFAELQSLAVLPERRNGGLGTRLLRAVYREVRAAGVEEMAVGVLATNDAALRLYEREGFRPWVVLALGKVPSVPPEAGA